MKILSCGAGMQSTALALMACEQAITGTSLYPDVPIYDAIIFCDLGLEPETYAAIVGVDNLLRDKTPMPPMKSALFMSRSRKRIADLTPEDCNDAECFEYCGQQSLNGF